MSFSCILGILKLLIAAWYVILAKAAVKRFNLPGELIRSIFSENL